MSTVREAIRTCATPSTWSKGGRVSRSVRAAIDLMNNIVWMDLEIGATYNKLREIMSVTGQVDLHNVHEGFYSITDEEIQTAKDEADYLIEICKHLGLKVEFQKWCKDHKLRTFRRWPTYGDIVTLPRDWVIRYLSGDAEPVEARPDRTAIQHKYDDRWWKDERDNELGFEHNPIVEILTFKDVWEDRAHEVASMVDSGKARTKCQATLEIMLDHAQTGEWDEDGKDIIAKRVYFSKKFRDYCYKRWMEPVQGQSPEPPRYNELTDYCWSTIKQLISKGYNVKTWNYKNEKGEYAFRRLHDWALSQMKAARELSRLEELSRYYVPGQTARDQRVAED